MSRRCSANRTRWERDVQGRVTREIRADNTTDTLYTHDLAGRLKTVTDPKDQVTTHSYNLDDSLSGTAYTNEEIETPNVSYTHDTYYVRIATMVDGIGTTSYTYKTAGTNGAGQVATIDGPLSNDTIAYSYDELGRVTQRTINGSANQVDWTFDALGRVTSEENLLGEFTYTYDGVTSRLATVTYPNDQTSTYGYYDETNDHRLQTIHHKYPNASTLSKFDYTYDAAGNILTWRQQSDSTAVVWEYVYDQVDQLLAAVKKSTATPATVLQRFAYAYDPAGNRTVEQIDDQIMLSAYDNLNQLTSQAPGGPLVVAGSLNEPGTVTISGSPVIVDSNNSFRGTVPTSAGTNVFTIVARDATGNTTTNQYQVDVAGTAKTFSYDANGNRTMDGLRTFEWDAVNRATAETMGSVRLERAYDARNRLARRVWVEGGLEVQRQTLVLSRSKALETRSGSGSVLEQQFGSGVRIGTAERFLSFDHLQSVRDVTSATAARLVSNTYDPSGRLVAEGETVDFHEAFNGYLAASDGLQFEAPHRLYDADAGRWISPDPLGSVDGLNHFLFVRNNPIKFPDPLGLKIECQFDKLVHPVKPDTPCPPDAAGCVKGYFASYSFPCEQMACSSQWKFDANVIASAQVWYSQDPDRTLYSSVPRTTMRQHEDQHVGDYSSFCRAAEGPQSEGFQTRQQCERARMAWTQWIDQIFDSFEQITKGRK